MSRASCAIKGTPCLLLITGSTTRGQSASFAHSATTSMMADVPRAPVLVASGGMSLVTVVQLIPNQRWIQRLHGSDRLSVLHGQQGDNTHPVRPKPVEGLEVSLNASSTRGV